MADHVTATSACFRFPKWSGAVAGAASIEPESSHSHEHMTVSDVDGDPIAVAFLSVVKEPSRGETTTE